MTVNAPDGQASMMDRCAACDLWEEPFMIYSKPICEDCFWDDDFPDNMYRPTPDDERGDDNR